MSGVAREEGPELVCVDPARVHEFWPHVGPLLDEAFNRFGSNDERKEVENGVRQGVMLLWLAWSSLRKIECALVTDLIKEDDYLVCRLRALAGCKVSRWIALLEKIEDYARAENCKFIRYVGRRGWVMMLGEDYRVTHVRAEKRLKEG